MKKALANNLKALRKINGLSQEQVADSLDISQSTYSRIENGETNSWTFHVEKVCRLYNISLEVLLFKTITK
jgi:transcriptional regulator with XRE-family HTH domain